MIKMRLFNQIAPNKIHGRTKVIMNNRVGIISGQIRGGKIRDSEMVCFSDSLYINTV